jgi:hypothetical protein
MRIPHLGKLGIREIFMGLKYLFICAPLLTHYLLIIHDKPNHFTTIIFQINNFKTYTQEFIFLNFYKTVFPDSNEFNGLI